MRKVIDREEVRRLIRQGAQLIEVLPEEEFEEEHLPGAINMPLKDLESRWQELDRDRPIITYCYDYQ